MNNLKLFFNEDIKPELIRASFTHALLKVPCVSVRGRTPGAYESAGNFQWRSAVQALVILFLRWLVYPKNDPKSILEGGIGSAASSLEFALRKLPRWTIDMFGMTDNGVPVIKRILHHSNSGRRRGGPVAVSLRHGSHQSIEIEVYIANKKITSIDVIQNLLNAIELNYEHESVSVKSGKLKGRVVQFPNKESRNNNNFISLLTRPVREEILFALRSLNIFSPKKVKQVLIEMIQTFERLGCKKVLDDKCCSQLIDNVSNSHVFDSLSKSKALNQKVSVWHAPVANAHNAIFFHAQKRNKLDFNIRIDFLHAGEMLEQLAIVEESELPDVISLGAYTSQILLTKLAHLEYYPILLAPKVGIRILTSEKNISHVFNKGRLSGTVVLTKNIPSSSSMYRDVLQERDVLNTKSSSEILVLPSEMNNLFDSYSNEHRIFMPFPHHVVYNHFYNYSYCDAPLIADSYQDGLILARPRVSRNKNLKTLLVQELMSAWAELQLGGRELDSIVEYFLTDNSYSHGMKNSLNWSDFVDKPELYQHAQ
jgi:hypothetical protein